MQSKLPPIFFSLLFSCITFVCHGQTTYASLIGEDEKEYERLIADCSSMLLEVTDNSMDEAYKVWTSMLQVMESKAETEGLDIKGMKLWINAFWNKDGSINKIVYYPKPNSKNMDFDQISSFLDSFAEEYMLPLESENCYSHYGSASFPIFSRVVSKKAK